MAEAVMHYLLRVWWESEGERQDGAWRASLRNVNDGKLLTFSEPEALMRYLNDRALQAARTSHS